MIAIIPARGRSKGLPGKNIRLLNGIPLICYSIKSALQAKSISKVIVSTDDDEIAKIAEECGAEVPFIRPKNLAEDNSMVMDAYIYTIDQLESQSKEKIESFVALLPTAPFRLSRDIDNAVEIFKNNNADSVVSITNAHVPIDWYRRIDKNNLLFDYLPQFDAISNRQELDQAYIPNGAIYIFHTEKLRETRQYYMSRTYPYIMPRSRSIDIDTLEDFQYAEFLIGQKNDWKL